MTVIVVCQLIAGAGTADGVDIQVLALRQVLLHKDGIRDQVPLLRVHHALGDRDQRGVFRQDGQDLFHEPVQTKAGNTVQHDIRTLQRLLHFFDLVVLDPGRQGAL